MKKLFAMLLALCMMCGAMVAGAEETAAPAVQEIKVGNMAFDIPAELTFVTSQTVEAGMEIAMYECARYQVLISSANWPLMPYIFDCTSADEQYDNFFLFAYLLHGSEIASGLVNQASSTNEGMLDGQELVYCATDGLADISHYYRDNGFWVMVMQGDEPLTAEQCLEIGMPIARSFRLDGVTEEEMAADAEAARIAAEEAAAKAAAQKYIVIKNGTANIRSGPGSDHDRITTAKQGDTFPLLGEEGTWYMIEVNGQTAYVSKGLCEIKE